MLGKQRGFQQLQNIRFKAGRTVVVVDAEVADKVVGNPVQLGLRGGSRTDVHFPVKLSGITGYDGAAQPFGQIQAEACLAYACRTGQDNQGLHPALKIGFGGTIRQVVEAGKTIGVQFVQVEVLVAEQIIVDGQFVGGVGCEVLEVHGLSRCIALT